MAKLSYRKEAQLNERIFKAFYNDGYDLVLAPLQRLNIEELEYLLTQAEGLQVKQPTRMGTKKEARFNKKICKTFAKNNLDSVAEGFSWLEQQELGYFINQIKYALDNSVC